jgi:hypothetical protein
MAQSDSLVIAYQKISELMKQEKWADAYRACIEVLRFDPENIKVIRLKNRIESGVRKANIKALKEDMKQLMPLYKARNFPVLMENLKQLESYVNQYLPLKKFMMRVAKEYEAYQANEREKLYHLEIENIKRIVKEGNFQEALRQAEKLRVLNIHYPEVRVLLQSVKDHWINHELELKRDLLDSEKYEDMLIFYQGLLRIDGKSEKIKKLIARDKKRGQMHKVEEKRDYIYAGLEKIKTLFQLRKYESAMMASREILEIDPENPTAKKYYEHAKHKVRTIMEREVIEQIKKAQVKNKQDFRLNRKNYVRI